MLLCDIAMASIDDMIKDPEWKLNLDKDMDVRILGDFIADGESTELRAVIRELNNGLLIASIEDEEGGSILSGKKYNVESMKLPNQYSLVSLRSGENPLQGFYATFEYKDGGISDKNPRAHLKYTTLHTNGKEKFGLNMLISLYAMELVGDQKLTLSLVRPREFTGQSHPNALLGFTGEPGGAFYYDNDGILLPDSPGFKNFPENMKGPLAKLFYAALERRAMMDTLLTAKILVKEFPSLSYKLPTQPLLL